MSVGQAEGTGATEPAAVDTLAHPAQGRLGPGQPLSNPIHKGTSRTQQKQAVFAKIKFPETKMASQESVSVFRRGRRAWKAAGRGEAQEALAGKQSSPSPAFPPLQLLLQPALHLCASQALSGRLPGARALPAHSGTQTWDVNPPEHIQMLRETWQVSHAHAERPHSYQAGEERRGLN